MKKSFLFVFAFLSTLLSCGPKPISFLKVGSPGTEGILLEEVKLYYSHEQAPKEIDIIEHITETGRASDCKQAALIAIVKMQKRALQAGANAIVNLKSKTSEKKEKKVKPDEGFLCDRAKSLEEGTDLATKVWEITWEGDMVRIIPSTEAEENQNSQE